MFILLQNATIGTVVVTVRAIDADIGANGAVRFRLRESLHFSIHAATGALRTVHSLDRDKQTTYRVSYYNNSKRIDYNRSFLFKLYNYINKLL